MKLIVSFVTLVLFFGCKGENTGLNVDEPLYQEQWALHYDKPFYEAYEIEKDAHIHATNSMNSLTGKGIRIAIIDMGLDENHDEYKSNVVKLINSADGSSNVKCTNSEDCYHGSAVTGIIASNINGKGLRGIAPDVEIVFIKLDLAGHIGDDEILNALEYAEKENVDIINNSWGTGDISPIIKEKIDEMATNGRGGKGVIFVFATGNKGKENNDDESMEVSVIGVGSTDEENLRAVYSNFGEGLDVVAPGGFSLGITTTYISDDKEHINNYMKAEDYVKFRGTSASAPIVAGAIALLLERDPSLTRKEIQETIRENTDKIGNVEYIEGKNNYYGYGKLNVDKMVGNFKTSNTKPVSRFGMK